ncbi:hypothetical protein ACTXG5_25555 [Mycobacterium sp. Dal123C01]|uniref:hypothetical protein n=1 Tax=Mycobacterium sp. Dal123C01 TaxID=3457577 RepID=UPI00403E5784
MTGKQPFGRDQPTGSDSQNANASDVDLDVTIGDCERLTLDKMMDCLGWQDGEHTAVCHQPVGGEFSASVVESANATARIESLPPRSDTWFSVNPTVGPASVGGRRGGDRKATRWAALVLDVDVKPGAFPDLDQASEFVDAVSGMVGTRPSVVIHSGHGLQPLWPIEDGVLDTEDRWRRASTLSRRFGRLGSRVANEFSAGLDNVSDLARIVRVPETTNWKNPADPVPVYAIGGSGGPLNTNQVEEFLDEWAPQIASDEPVAGEVVSPPESWKLGSYTCAYVAAMVRSWGGASDRPKAGRHQWAMTRCVRLAAARRLGCISKHGLDQALLILERALEHWCQITGAPRGLAPDEIGSAYRWAEAKAATFHHLRARTELGNHQPCLTRARKSTLVPR